MTEKNYNPEQKQMKAMTKQAIASNQKTETVPIKEEKKIEENKKKEETKVEEKKEDKKTIQKKEKIKKDEAVVNGISLPISTKTSVAICKFIRRKTIEKAIADLEEVAQFKRAIPMTGEIPHRKGKGIMSGRYPIKAIGYFIKMLKNLQANAIVNGVEDGIIAEAIPNRASLPYGRGGAIRRKRTHVKIKIVEKKIKEKKK
jgi:ribosomal protein L22